MKKLLMTVMALSCFAFSSYGQKKVEKQIIGKWCNPYTYQSTGELKGFEFKKGGKCSAVNIPSLDLKTWKIDKDGYLIVMHDETVRMGSLPAWCCIRTETGMYHGDS